MTDNNGKKAVKAALAYTIGNVLIKGINFVTLPIFSRLLSTEQFGIYSVFLSYESILYVIIGFAFHSSVRSAKVELKKIDDYISSITLVYIGNLFFLCVVASLFSKHLSLMLNFDRSIVLLLILFAFSSAIITLFNERVALDYSYKKYLVISLLNSVGNVVISLILIFTVFKTKMELGRIIGVTLSGIIISICVLCSFYRKAKPKYRAEYWKFAFKYSLPIIPHGLSQVLLSQYDRIMIRKIIGNSAAGIFSLAGNIQIILSVITSSISTSWSTWFYEEIEKKDKNIIVKYAQTLSLLFASFTIGIMAISSELIDILGGSRYVGAKYVVIPIVADAFILFLYSIIVPAEYYKKKTIYVMEGTIVAAILDIILNYVFIRKYGYIAAAYTTLFAYICYLILHIVISRKVIGFYIVPLRYLLSLFLVIFASSIWNLLLIESIIPRMLLCFLAIILLMVFLGKTNPDIVKIILNQVRKGESHDGIT